MKVNALLDSGSDSTLVTKTIADKLKLEGKSQILTMSNAVCSSTKTISKLVNFHIFSPSHPSKIPISNEWVVENLDLPRFKINKNTIKKEWKHFQDPSIEVDNSKEISILIGADFPHLHLSRSVRIGKETEPIAILKPLGWVLMGGKGNGDCVNTNLLLNETGNLSRTVEQFWAMESYGTVSKGSVSLKPLQEQRALKHLENTVEYKNNRYTVRNLWKENQPSLPFSKSVALSRFSSLEKKFERDPEFANKYKETINEYVNKGHAVRLTQENSKNVTPITNYVPHHGVVNSNKPGKVRVVFDVAAQFQNTSLNKNLLKGPDYLNSLVGILLRFRRDNFAAMADIEQMYHQIKVKESDQDALRFVWRNTPEEEIDDHKMTVHIFGKIDLPCIANWVIKRTASDQSNKYPVNIINTIHEKFYMDDYLNCFSSEERAIDTIQKVISILSNGGFRLTKWLSNNKNILKSVPPTERSPKIVNLDLENIPVERALGIIWNPQRDMLRIKGVTKNVVLTKRGLLSFISSIYDPVGLIAPVTLEPKLIIQDLWRRQIDWDVQLPDDLKLRWTKWKQTLQFLEDVEIPRWYGFTNTEFGQVQLHIFADASQYGYGAVVYIRYLQQDFIHCSFVIGKSRLAPIQKKSTSIPRLELQAAVTTVRLKDTCIEELKMKVDNVYF